MESYHGTILREIESADLSTLSRYGWENRNLIPYLYAMGSLAEEDITEALAKNISRQAEEDFGTVIREKSYNAKGISRPELLAYRMTRVLGNNIESGPSFGGVSASEFCKKHRNPGLMETLRRELLEPSMPENV